MPGTTSSQSPFSNESNTFYDLSPDHPLCLCEYMNQHGQRSHLLMCCCNCEAFDTLCTKLCCGDLDETAEHSTRSRWRLCLDVFSDIFDRIRIPCPGGARRFDIDLVFALVIVFIYLYFGSAGFFSSLLVIAAVPIVAYARFFSIRLTSKSANTQLAFYMLNVSFLAALFTFNSRLAAEIAHVASVFEQRLVNFGLITCLVGLFYLKNSNPGFIRSNHNLRVIIFVILRN